MNTEKRCYVYSYIRSRESQYGEVGSPYYIGKGKHFYGRYSRAFNQNHNVPVPKDKNNVIILADNLTDADARQVEMLLIHLHGRIDTGRGCLRNLTDGGDGASGKITPDEVRKKISDTEKGKIIPPEIREKMRISHLGKKRSKEIGEKISAALKGRVFSEEHKRNLSIAWIGRVEKFGSLRKPLKALDAA